MELRAQRFSVTASIGGPDHDQSTVSSALTLLAMVLAGFGMLLTAVLSSAAAG